MRAKHIVFSLLPGFLAAACATSAAPTERLANSQGSLRAAEEIGADKVPQAALYMQLAREEITKAKALMKDDDNMRADWTLRRAEADASLALALAKGEPEIAKANELKQQLRALKPDAAKQDATKSDAPKADDAKAEPAKQDGAN